MAGFNNFYNSNPNFYQQQRYISPYEPQYVTGIQGANAFQLPPGVQQMILWDTDNDSFYIKKLDEMGRPKVVAWKDFTDHVEPTPQVQQNQSGYLTTADIQSLLSNFMTKDDFEKALGELSVGERGRIVRNELDT